MSPTGRHTLPVNNIHQNIYHYDGARASYSSTGMRKGKKKYQCRQKHSPELVSSAAALLCAPGQIWRGCRCNQKEETYYPAPPQHPADARCSVPAVHYDRPRVWNASLCPIHLVQKAQNPSWFVGHPVVWPAKILIVLHQPRALVLQGAETHHLVRKPLPYQDTPSFLFTKARVTWPKLKHWHH